MAEAVIRYAIGVGCRRGCPAAIIEGLVRDACAGLMTPLVMRRDDRAAALRPLGLFTIDLKRDEDGLHAAAAALGLPLSFFSSAELEAKRASVLTRSARVARITGVPAVAEAAALAGAGPGARLLGPRMASAGATCALAAGEGVA